MHRMRLVFPTHSRQRLHASISTTTLTLSCVNLIPSPPSRRSKPLTRYPSSTRACCCLLLASASSAVALYLSASSGACYIARIIVRSPCSGDATTEELAAAGTTLQAAALPQVMAGKNVVLAAETGSGKTLAYLAPVVEAVLRRRAAEGGVVDGDAAPPPDEGAAPSSVAVGREWPTAQVYRPSDEGASREVVFPACARWRTQPSQPGVVQSRQTREGNSAFSRLTEHAADTVQACIYILANPYDSATRGRSLRGG